MIHLEHLLACRRSGDLPLPLLSTVDSNACTNLIRYYTFSWLGFPVELTELYPISPENPPTSEISGVKASIKGPECNVN